MKDLPDVCRLRILGFLLLDDLAEAAIVCKQFRDDCMDESLPQEGTAVLRIPRSCAHEDRVERLRTRLVAMAAATSPDGQRKFHNFSRIRIVDPHRDVSHRVRWQRHYQRPFATTIPEITALD
jgi:3-phenylpropionate/cinnamic acid dioxygenase small subunit